MKQTAVEFLKDYELGNTGKIDIDDAKEALIEFTKMHVKAALKEASKATLLYDFKEEITSSYPLENIK